eukprot:1515901-Amphidinium_carterae.1
MQEAAHLLKGMCAESLVLIDELGRGTAHVDGIALCWAISERLLDKRVYTLFATHFFEVCRLQSVFQNFRNMHLEVLPNENSGKSFRVRHITSLDELLSKPQRRYGLAMAEEVGLPVSLLHSAHAAACHVDRRLALQLPYRPSRLRMRRNDGRAKKGLKAAALETVRQLLALAAESGMNEQEVGNALGLLQEPWLEVLDGKHGAKRK